MKKQLIKDSKPYYKSKHFLMDVTPLVGFVLRHGYADAEAPFRLVDVTDLFYYEDESGKQYTEKEMEKLTTSGSYRKKAFYSVNSMRDTR